VCKQQKLLGGMRITLHSFRHLPALLIFRVTHLVSRWSVTEHYVELRQKQSVQMTRGSQGWPHCNSSASGLPLLERKRAFCEAEAEAERSEGKRQELLGGTCITLHSFKHLPALLILWVSHLVSLLERNRAFCRAEVEAER